MKKHDENEAMIIARVYAASLAAVPAKHLGTAVSRASARLAAEDALDIYRNTRPKTEAA